MHSRWKIGTGKTVTLKLLAVEASKQNPVYIVDVLGNIRIKGFDRINIKAGDDGATLGKLLSRKSKNPIIISFRDMMQSEIVIFLDAFFANWNISNAVIFIDEIHDVLPQNAIATKYSIELERAIKHWRNKNDGFIFATQRPAYCNKNVLALADFFVIYRMTFPIDVKLISELVGTELPIENKEFLNGYLIDFRIAEGNYSNKNKVHTPNKVDEST